MLKVVLIIIATAHNGGVAFTTVEFDSMEACKVAAAETQEAIAATRTICVSR